MGKSLGSFQSMNGGEIGGETLNRVTIENYGSTAETLENIWVDANGPFCLRPGLQFLADMGTSKHRIHPFVRSINEKFVMLLADGELRIASDGDIIARPAVSSVVTNGDFASLSGWTNISASGTSATIVSGRLALNADGLAIAGVRQAVTTANAGTLHALEIHVHHGPVTFKCGTTAGGNDLIDEMDLRTGHYSLAFTPPSSTYYVEFTSALQRQVEVESIQVAGTGDLVLETPWAEADLQGLRFWQSLNVLYAANGDVQQRRIERWDNNSWSVSETQESDGPFRDPNTDESLTITPTVRVGNGNLVASRNLFKPGHVGSLWRITQAGQFESRTVNGDNQWSDPVQVQGVGASRAVSFTVGAGLTATVRIQRSIGNTTSWADATTSSTTSGDVTISTSGGGAAQAFNDGLDNNNVYYRVGIKTGEYTSGSAVVTIYYPFATTQGIVRVTNYSSPTVVAMEVLETLSLASASADWEEGAWSNYRGWPKALVEFDGRLWSLRDDRFWGSYSDAFESHKVDEGASSAVSRSIAVGAANSGQWIMPLGRLVIGTEGAEVVVRSNSLDEPLSTTNMTVREMSTYGVGDVQPVKVDTRCLYVDASGFHLMEIVYNVQIQDYVARPLTTLHRDIGRPGLTQLAVLRRPDTRVFAVRSDGQMLTKLFDPTENIMGWARWKSPGAGGIIESVAVLPAGNQNQDEVYVIVARTIGGVTKRYFEKLAEVHYETKAEACRLDSHVDVADTASFPAADVTVSGNMGLPAVILPSSFTTTRDALVLPDGIRTVTASKITTVGNTFANHFMYLGPSSGINHYFVFSAMALTRQFSSNDILSAADVALKYTLVSPFRASSAYTVGQRVQISDKVFSVNIAGTTGGSAPSVVAATTRGAFVTSGSVTFELMGDDATPGTPGLTVPSAWSLWFSDVHASLVPYLGLRPDSNDAYAGVILSAIANANPSATWLNAAPGVPGYATRIALLAAIAQSNIIGQMDASNLTQTFQSGVSGTGASYTIRFLADNCEAAAGLYALAKLYNIVGNTASRDSTNTLADTLRSGILALWDSGASRFRTYYGQTGIGSVTGDAGFVSDLRFHIWPALCGLLQSGEFAQYRDGVIAYTEAATPKLYNGLVNDFPMMEWYYQVSRIRGSSAVSARTEGRARYEARAANRRTLADVALYSELLFHDVPESAGKQIVDVAAPGVFASTDVGRTISIDGGKILITSYVSSSKVLGVVTEGFSDLTSEAGIWAIYNPIISGLDHLEGQQVYVWADGSIEGPLTVTSGKLTISQAASRIFVGLYYEGKIKSSKLAFGAKMGTALAQRGRASKVAFMLRKFASGGLQFGQTFDRMDTVTDASIPSDGRTEENGLIGGTTVLLTAPGRINLDPRLCLKLPAPYPGWVDGYVIGEEQNERVT